MINTDTIRREYISQDVARVYRERTRDTVYELSLSVCQLTLPKIPPLGGRQAWILPQICSRQHRAACLLLRWQDQPRVQQVYLATMREKAKGGWKDGKGDRARARAWICVCFV